MSVLQYNFINKIAELKFVNEIWLFGSRARGDNLKRSDIDLAIICNDINDNDWLKVLEIIDNADTLLKIDCVRFNILLENDPLKLNILKDKKVLYAKT